MRLHALFAALLLVAAPAARAAERLVLLPATGANVDEGELVAATDLLRAGLEQTGRFAVVLGRTTGGNVTEPSPAEAAAEAAEAGAALAVTLRISRLGSVSSARLGAYKPDGTLAHSDALSAANADDLEPVLQRLARGLGAARPAAELATIDTVTEREARPLRQVPASFDWGFRIGATWFVDGPGGDTGRLTGAGAFWLFDARSFLAEATADWQSGDGDHLLEGGLAVHVPFSRQNVAPYAGAGFGYAIVNAGDETDAGLTVRGAAGVIFGRLSSVKVRVEGGWRTTLFTLRAADGRREAVHGPYASAGIGF